VNVLAVQVRVHDAGWFVSQKAVKQQQDHLMDVCFICPQQCPHQTPAALRHCIVLFGLVQRGPLTWCLSYAVRGAIFHSNFLSVGLMWSQSMFNYVSLTLITLIHVLVTSCSFTDWHEYCLSLHVSTIMMNISVMINVGSSDKAYISRGLLNPSNLVGCQ
jgi:hypothetical protein